MVTATDVSYGISTAPQQVTYAEVLRVWQEADAISLIEHAWLFDHLMPIRGDLDGPIFEGWTLLSALAAATSRLRLGLLVTSNRFRPPSMLAKIAVTVDAVSGGRLDFGIGAGSRPSVSFARREYVANGFDYLDGPQAVASLDEACEIIRRVWTEPEPFDFDGTYHHLQGAFSNPKPVQQPHPPIVIGGRARATLRVVAKHAQVWNVPGGDIADAVRRSAMLDDYCAEIGRDPAQITRSMVIPASYDQPESTRAEIAEATGAGFSHIILALASPYPPQVGRWVADELISDTH